MTPELFEWYTDLSKAFPIEGQTVRLVEIEGIDHCGESHFDNCTIYINKDMETHEKIETLCHEWAHLLDMYTNGYTEQAHRDSWGIMYAQVYRRVIDQ